MSIESKTILAKLMAQENLHIEQRAVSTASFNTKTRVLTVPILNNDIKPWTYDLFMGHEVGHALWTTPEDLQKAFQQKLNKSICNIVEDYRIERMIKAKYPGLKNSFSRAYKELFADNFFGTEGLDLNKMNFIDRVNLYCKVGVATGIKFDGEESALLNEIENTQTFDDVIAVVKKIKSHMEEQEEERKKQKALANANDGDSDEYEEDEFDEDSESLSDPSEVDDPSDEPLQDREDDGAGSGAGEKQEDTPQEITSHTEQQYRENEKKLFAENATERCYANIAKMDPKKTVMDFKEVYKLWAKEVSDRMQSKVIVETEEFIKIRNNSSKTVSYLVKEFELRKNADQLKRATTAKTGELNMNKIYSYKFNEDIFKKISVVPGGKSHGLVMFLDWSGSMIEHIENTVKQLISLVLFCKKVNIPYEVYAFNTPETYYQGPQSYYQHNSTINEIVPGKFRLLNILSSRMNASEFTKSCSILVSYLARSHFYRPIFMSMGGTPLNETIMAAMEIVPAFQKQYRLQNVNTVFLTDGEGHTLREISRLDESGLRSNQYLNSYMYGRDKKDLVLVDPVTKCEAVVKNMDSCDSHTAAYLSLFKKRTGSNVIGFFVMHGREFGKNVKRWYSGLSSQAIDEMKVKFRKNKYQIVSSSGYDEYYLLRSDAMDTEEDIEFEVRENATTRGLVSAFTKYAGNRVNSRVVLNKFIGMIA